MDLEKKVSIKFEDIKLNTGETVEINKNDIVVFVGPNNVGKSQALKDIALLVKNYDNYFNNIIVKSANNKRNGNIEELEALIQKYAVKITDNGTYRYVFLEKKVFPEDIKNFGNEQIKHQDRISDFFITNITTDVRLNISNPPNSVNMGEAKTHPIQYVANNPDLMNEIEKYFSLVFKTSIIPFTDYGRTIPLVIGKKIPRIEKISKKEGTPYNQIAEYKKILHTYPFLHEQGDGMRGFVGVLLNLIVPHYSIALIDEPETFLHPQQSYLMGETIAEISQKNNLQIFISTHSEQIIKGLLETAQKRVKIIRITREGNKNSFSNLSSTDIVELWSDPIMRYSNMLSSLFSEKTVLCESEADCKLYSTIYSEQMKKKNKVNQINFVHCNGKSKMHKIVKNLKKLGIDIITIVDIDIYRKETDFKNLIKAYSGNWDEIKNEYKMFVDEIDTHNKNITYNDFQKCVEEIFESNPNDGQEITSQNIKKIQKAIKENNIWLKLKQHGVEYLKLSKELYEVYETIQNFSKKMGINIVNGEMETFIEDISNQHHGGAFLTMLFEKHPDLSDSAYKKINKFIKDTLIS